MGEGMITYKCFKCGHEIGQRQEGDGISFAKFTKQARPSGKGSGLYCEWTCRDCDNVGFDYYLATNRLCLRPWMYPTMEGISS